MQHAYNALSHGLPQRLGQFACGGGALALLVELRTRELLVEQLPLLALDEVYHSCVCRARPGLLGFRCVHFEGCAVWLDQRLLRGHQHLREEHLRGYWVPQLVQLLQCDVRVHIPLG